MKILIIDSSYLMYKSYFAFRNKHLSVVKAGETINTSAVFGFTREIINLMIKFGYNFLICAWDSPPYIKKNKIPSYKERPKKDTPSLELERKLIKAILFSLKIPSLSSEGYEGEEVASSIINKLKKEYKTVDLYANDEDCFSLISNKTSLINTKKSALTKFNKKDLMKKYEVTPKQFIQFKALTGCRTDKVTGVKGVGPEKARWLINRFGTINNIKKNIGKIETENEKIAEKLKKSIKDGSLKESRYLTKINKPKKLIRFIPTENNDFKDILEYLEANTLITGSNYLSLKFIKINQKKQFKKIRRIVKWKKQ